MDFEDIFDGELDPGEMIIIGGMAEQIAEEEVERRRLLREMERDADEEPPFDDLP